MKYPAKIKTLSQRPDTFSSNGGLCSIPALRNAPRGGGSAYTYWRSVNPMAAFAAIVCTDLRLDLPRANRSFHQCRHPGEGLDLLLDRTGLSP